MRTLVIGLNLLVLSMYPIQVQANTPLDTIKLRINQLFDVLRDPAFQGEAVEEIKKKKILGRLEGHTHTERNTLIQEETERDTH